MNLNDKIYQNIVTQMTIAYKLNRARDEVAQLERENTSTIGGMNVLAEFYKDETGRDLQQDINVDPQWKAMLDKADGEAQLAAVKEAQPAPEQSTPSPAAAATAPPEQPKLRKVGTNKQVAGPAPAPAPAPPVQAAAQPAPAPHKEVDRTRPPVSVVIEGDAPPPPSSAEAVELDARDA